ncbi:MAG: flagellar biosynthetic protein FliO [Firmicutes bacterium]|nr:flagellar biosynthetic protein FliO [Bacillota bacterium]
MTEVEPIGTWDMIWYASRVLLALVVLVPLLYYVLRFLGRRLTVSRSIKGSMEVVDILPLGGGKQLLLVKLGERVLLLSISKDRVLFLWEVPDGEIMQVEPHQSQDRTLNDLKQWVDRWRKGRQGDERGEGEDS